MKFRFLTITRHELHQLLAAFILGLIIGGVIINLITAHQIDRLIYKNKELTNKIQTKNNELEKLEESLANRKWKIIQKLEIVIETEENKHIKQQLEEKLYELLESIVGRQMNKIDGTLISNTIDDRVILVDGTNYKINLIWLLLQRKTIVKVEAASSD